MFSQLIASRPESAGNRPLTPTFFSLSCHAAIIGGAVVLTMPPPEPVRVPAMERSIDWTLVADPSGRSERAPGAVRSLPSPDQFQGAFDVSTVEIPTTVPVGIMIVPPHRPQVRPSAFGSLTDNGSGANGVVATEYVDEPPVALGGFDIRYPDALRQAGVEGSVLLEFVVDTAGQVEAESVRLIRTNHRAFVNEAIRSVRRARFLPARVRGRPVRVLVRQQVSFRLSARGYSDESHP